MFSVVLCLVCSLVYNKLIESQIVWYYSISTDATVDEGQRRRGVSGVALAPETYETPDRNNRRREL